MPGATLCAEVQAAACGAAQVIQMTFLRQISCLKGSFLGKVARRQHLETSSEISALISLKSWPLPEVPLLYKANE